MEAARVIIEGVSKRFGSSRALRSVSFALRPGEVHALMGENGAGKSTLGRVLAGLVRPDEGYVRIDGRPLRLGSIEASARAGVRIVHQELSQCPNLSVAENLCLHAMPRTRGVVDFRAMTRRARELVRDLDPTIDVTRPLGSLGPGHRQLCQIAAALDERAGVLPSVIVFDEPTSSLSESETERLHAIVRRIAARGITAVYVSHRIGEIFACCDRATVLRDGALVATTDVSELDERTLVEQMLGRARVAPVERTDEADAEEAAFRSMMARPEGADRPEGVGSAEGEVLLGVRDLTSPGRLRGVSFDVRAGEVLGLGGLVGSGRTGVLNAVFGIDGRRRGRVTVAGRELPAGRPRAAIAAGVGYVPEDRRLQGLFFNLGVDENILAPVMGRLAGPLGVRSLARERELVRERVRSFRIKAGRADATRPGELSGGNQQKLLIARWMHAGTRVLLLDEPTRGIDVGTKSEIHRLIRQAAEGGAAVVVVSSELPELLAISDRVRVMNTGRLAGELEGEELTRANLLTLAMREHAPEPGAGSGAEALAGAV